MMPPAPEGDETDVAEGATINNEGSPPDGSGPGSDPAATSSSSSSSSSSADALLATDRDDGDDVDVVDVEVPPSSSPAPPPVNKVERRSLNSRHGNRAGLIQTLSLILNSGLMLYAHLGPLGEIYSSRDPASSSASSAGMMMTSDGGVGLCAAEEDVTAWTNGGGSASRPAMSNYCSREYEGGCFLDAACIERCFVEVYGFSESCSTCFGVLPTCSVNDGCMMACSSDSFGEECTSCNEPCVEELAVCTGLPSGGGGVGLCTAEEDITAWTNGGGSASRPAMSNYCSREYEGGCFLDAACIERCFVEVYGFSESCSTCFGVLPTCSVNTGCMMACSSDSFGEECRSCNEPCVEELAVCTGLPSGAVCTPQDEEIWTSGDDEVHAKVMGMFRYCATVNGGSCLLNATCVETCVTTFFGYSGGCAGCFGESSACGVDNGCTLACVQNNTGPECVSCTSPCVVELATCTGFSSVNSTVDDDASSSQASNEAVFFENCNEFDLESIETWYGVYGIRFIQSVKDAWNGDAKLLAVIIVMFSGLWPYIKSIMLIMLWYLPTTVKTQTATLLWLARLSKYTLIDVFALIVLFVGVQLQLDIGGTEAVTRAEPRLGLIAFFWATVWQYLQIEIVKSMHERTLSTMMAAAGEEGDRLLFLKLWIPSVVLVASVGLFVAGAVTELVYFTSVDSAGVCTRSYNLVSLVLALLSEIGMTSNSVPAQMWALFMNYVVLILVFPIVTHLLQIVFIVGWFRSKKLKYLSEGTLIMWLFASIEPLLIGIFAVEYKFPNLIMKIAGETNAQFLDIDSRLGIGFYILIAYSVVAGFLQYSLRIRHCDGSKQSPLINEDAAVAEKEKDLV